MALVVENEKRTNFHCRFTVDLFYQGFGIAEERNMTDKGKEEASLALSAKVLRTEHGEYAVICSLKNIGSKSIKCFLLPYCPWINVQINHNGKTQDLKPAILRRVLISKKNIVSVEAGQLYSFQLSVMKKEFIWPAPGNYAARIIYQQNANKVEGVNLWTGRVESNSFDLDFH